MLVYQYDSFMNRIIISLSFICIANRVFHKFVTCQILDTDLFYDKMFWAQIEINIASPILPFRTSIKYLRVFFQTASMLKLLIIPQL